ncbi:MAG: hypothetical protein FWE78_03400 [Methanimicrococcus sp.]|nr:hypothetical protein [Methanimicrococcus sp.]
MSLFSGLREPKSKGFSPDSFKHPVAETTKRINERKKKALNFTQVPPHNKLNDLIENKFWVMIKKAYFLKILVNAYSDIFHVIVYINMSGNFSA